LPAIAHRFATRDRIAVDTQTARNWRTAFSLEGIGTASDFSNSSAEHRCRLLATAIVKNHNQQIISLFQLVVKLMQIACALWVWSGDRRKFGRILQRF
jgi:hypothetical protein